jgi:hypothetical protein
MPDDWSPLDAAGRGRRPRPGSRPWFGHKQIGVGWSPRTWQGYLITTIVIVVIEAIAVGARGGWVAYLPAAIPFAVFGLKTAARRRR